MSWCYHIFMKYVYESPDKGKTVYRRPARLISHKSGGIELSRINEDLREVRQEDGSWVVDRPSSSGDRLSA